MSKIRVVALTAGVALALSACGSPTEGSEEPSLTDSHTAYADFRSAIVADDAGAVAEFLSAGESLDQDLGGGYEPLHVAAASNSPDAAQQLIDAGAELDATVTGGVTPLMLASESDGADTVVVLLDAGADARAQDDSGPGAGPMHYAARANNVAALQAYLEHGLDVDTLATYSTPLIFAAYSGASEASVFLLDNGANINATDRVGNDPIENAANGGFPDLAELLREYAASAD